MASDPFVWGEGGSKDTISQRRRLAEAMMKSGMDYSPVQHWTQGLARVAQALVGGYEGGQADKQEKSNNEAFAKQAEGLFGSSAPVSTASTPAAPSMAGGAGRTMAMPNVSPEMKDGIVQTASALGIDPVDLATTISYETGGTFDPTKAGPRTQWGQHRGLIQFGEPQAKQHGVDWSNPVASQLGANGAVASYLKAAGVQPGMGLMDIYSAINAGSVGKYGASDARNGGAPGTVADKVNNQMQGHRAKAQALFRAAQADMPADGAMPVAMETGQEGFAVPGQPAMTGQNFNAITSGAAPLDPAFQSEGASQPWMGTALQPQAPASPQMVQAPMPLPRPADLAIANPQADMPAPSAVQAMGQIPPQAMPDLSNENDAGSRILAATGGTGIPGAAASPLAGIAQALTGSGGAPAAAVAPEANPAVAKVAQAAASGGNVPPMARLGIDLIRSGNRSEGIALIAKALESQNKPQWIEQRLDDGSIAQRNSQTGEVKVVRPGVDPLVREGQRLEVESKKKALEKVEPPVTRDIEVGGVKTTQQWDPQRQVWVSPKSDAPVAAPTNPYALPGKPTEDQSKSAGFANRMAEAHSILDPIEEVGVDKKQAAYNNLPFGIGNVAISKERQSYNQAKENFITAQLRKESGAVISDSEFKREEQKYFPIPGDTPEQIKQKRQSRITAMQSMMGAAGSGYKVPEGFNVGEKKPAAAKQDGPPAPAGVDANVWKHMTAEERALWK